MSRVRVEKFGDNFYLRIDGQTKQFNRESSDDDGEGCKHVTKTTRSLLANELSKFSNPIFVFKGEPETV